MKDFDLDFPSLQPAQEAPRWSIEAALPKAIQKRKSDVLEQVIHLAMHGAVWISPALSAGKPAAIARRLESAEDTSTLRLRVQELERRLSEPTPTSVEPEVTSSNRYERWIEDNREELRKYPRSFVALDPERGIVLHSQDGAEFAAELSRLPDKEQERLLLFNTSMYGIK